MAAHAILNFGKYDNYVDETFAWYKWVRSLDDNSSNIPKTHDVISYRLAISSGSVFVEPGRNLPGTTVSETIRKPPLVKAQTAFKKKQKKN